jgi:hypothetical protein
MKNKNENNSVSYSVCFFLQEALWKLKQQDYLHQQQAAGTSHSLLLLHEL